jgi:hypothetical protein
MATMLNANMWKSQFIIKIDFNSRQSADIDVGVSDLFYRMVKIPSSDQSQNTSRKYNKKT